MSMKAVLPALVVFLSASVSAADVSPEPYYGEVGKRVATTLLRQHVGQHALDDEISRRAWTNLVSYYDFDHSVFLRSDIEAFKAHETTIDNELDAKDVSFGFAVHNLFVKRLTERLAYATNLVATTTWDFTTNETFQLKRKDAPWPETVDEAEELWRKRMKNDVMILLLNREIDGATNEFDVADNITKKYRQYFQAVTEPDGEAVLQHYLSAVSRAFDPHSDYMSPASREDFDMEMNLTLCGVGAVLSMDDGALKIIEVMPGGPIDRDGRIQEGDKIVGVKQGDGEMEDVMWQPMKKTIRKIRGEKGTRVTLDIIPRDDPSGASHKAIELVRDEIKLEDQAATGRVETVTLNGVTNKVGYIYLPGFYGTMDKRPSDPGFRSCAADVGRYVAEFNAEGISGLVLDLRGNGGGSLMEAVRLSALFVTGGPVVHIRNTRYTQPLLIPSGNPVAYRGPLVVLTDRASASASEIVAGHLKDTGRAIVIGDGTTHGKGTVQTVLGLGPEKYGSIKVTTARFYRINGASTQLKGVEADIHLPSLLDSLDIGEDKLTYALPFTKIRPFDYEAAWDLGKYVPELSRRSEARLAQNERYQKHLSNVAGMKEISEREELPLEHDARLAQMKLDRERREGEKEVSDVDLELEDTGASLDDRAEDDPAEKDAAEKDGKKGGSAAPKHRRRNQRPEDDVVLDEAFNILSDLVRLNEGNTLPLSRGELYMKLLGQ